VVLTMRVDFVGRCGEIVVNAAGLRLDRIAYKKDHRIFISQMAPEHLRDAIVKPTAQVGLTLQAGLADRMLDEIDREPGALPLLQDALDLLWQRRQGSVLTQSVYDELGGVVGALRRRADTLLDELAQQGDLRTAQRLLLALVSVAEDTALDTRQRVRLTELRSSVSREQDVASVDRVLQQLVSARLLVQDGDGQGSTVEVAREALIRK